MQLRLVSLLCAAGSFVACSSGGGAPMIGVIPKGVTHEFWQAIRLGAEQAGTETGYAIKWQGPSDETNSIAQLQIVEDLLSMGVKGLVLAPIHRTQCRSAVDKAKARGVPLAVIDSGLDAEGFVTFAATDNRLGGVLAAREMGRLLGGKGKVAVVMCKSGSASTEEREAGFRETLKAELPGMAIVDEQFGQSTREISINVATDMLTKHPDLDGMFGSNESSAFGLLVALRKAGKAGKVKAVGFDSAEELVAALREGTLHAVVVQNPWKMGYEGVHAVVKALKGDKPEARIDTGVQLVTKDNLDTPAIQKLLKPGK